MEPYRHADLFRCPVYRCEFGPADFGQVIDHLYLRHPPVFQKRRFRNGNSSGWALEQISRIAYCRQADQYYEYYDAVEQRFRNQQQAN